MPKISLVNTIGGLLSRKALDANFQAIQDEFNEKVLYRNNPDGEPNSMENELDMNSFRIYNLPEATQATEPVTYEQWQAALQNVEYTGIVRETVTDIEQGQTLVSFNVIEYTPGLGNLAIYLNGVRQAPSAYVETSTTSITFKEELDLGDTLEAIVNEIAGDQGAVTYLGGTKIRQTQTSTAGQSLFTLSNAYVPQTNNLNVFINGVRQYPVENYAETSDTSITFTSGLEDGDVAVTEITSIVDVTGREGGSSRPANPKQFETFFDTSISPARPIWYYNGAWVDATGTGV